MSNHQRCDHLPDLVLARQLVEKGRLDFLVMDYLSEITMSLLVGAKAKNPVSHTTSS